MAVDKGSFWCHWKPCHIYLNALYCNALFVISDDGVLYLKETGWKRQALQLRALLYKRCIHSLRYYILTLSQILIPVLCTALACSTSFNRESEDHFPALVLDLTEFKNPITPYSVESRHSRKSREYQNTLKLSDCYSTSVVRHSNAVYIDLNNRQSNDLNEYLIMIGEDHADQYNWNYQIGASISDGNSGQLEIIGFFNSQAYHTIAISLSYLGNTLMQCFGNRDFQIKTINHPLPRNSSRLIMENVGQRTYGMGFTFSISFGMAFLFATFLVFLIKERTSGAKHSQLVSGVRLHNFWLATFMWDYANYLVPSILIIIVILGFRIDAYWQRSWWVNRVHISHSLFCSCSLDSERKG